MINISFWRNEINAENVIDQVLNNSKVPPHTADDISFMSMLIMLAKTAEKLAETNNIVVERPTIISSRPWTMENSER